MIYYPKKTPLERYFKGFLGDIERVSVYSVLKIFREKRLNALLYFLFKCP